MINFFKGLFSFDNLKIYGEALKTYYLTVSTDVVSTFDSQLIMWKNEKVSQKNSDYYYSFPISLIKCTSGQTITKEYN